MTNLEREIYKLRQKLEECETGYSGTIFLLQEKLKDEKYRADIAERALRNAATRLKCKGGLGKGFCGVIDCDYYNCNNADGCVKAHLTQADIQLRSKKWR